MTSSQGEQKSLLSSNEEETIPDVVVNMQTVNMHTNNNTNGDEEKCSDYLSCEKLCAEFCTALFGFLAGIFCCCCGYVCALTCMNDRSKFFVYMIMVTAGISVGMIVGLILYVSTAMS